MDDSLRALEERLEQLVPKGLSDLGRERMEDQIDEMAGALEDSGSGSGSGWKWGLGAAAAVAAMAVAVAFWSPEGEQVLADGGGEPSPVGLEEVVAVPIGSDSEELLTLSYARRVDGRTDQGWVMTEGGESQHRYWSYAVTDEEELMDEVSGYAVRVVSQREEWVPVEVTSL